jgi:hypothetical protein
MEDGGPRHATPDTVLAWAAIPEQRAGRAHETVIVERLDDRGPAGVCCPEHGRRQQRHDVVDVDHIGAFSLDRPADQ